MSAAYDPLPAMSLDDAVYELESLGTEFIFDALESYSSSFARLDQFTGLDKRKVKRLIGDIGAALYTYKKHLRRAKRRLALCAPYRGHIKRYEQYSNAQTLMEKYQRLYEEHKKNIEAIEERAQENFYKLLKAGHKADRRTKTTSILMCYIENPDECLVRKRKKRRK